MNATNAPEPSFDQLYREVILEHYRAPHGKDKLARIDARAEGVNPLCGDEVDVHLSVAGETIDGVHVDGRGCAISVSSGSILHDLIAGRPAVEARRILAAVKDVLLHGGAIPSDPDLGDFEALEGVKKFPVRIKCALLPWTTLDEALRNLERSSHAGNGGKA